MHRTLWKIAKTSTSTGYCWTHLPTSLEVTTNIIHPSPVIVIASAIKKASFLPFVSEMRFMTIRPVNDPMGKQAWMMALAHSRSQKRPIDDVIVKLSTTECHIKVYLACIWRCRDMLRFLLWFSRWCSSSGIRAPYKGRVSWEKRTSWRSKRLPTTPIASSGTCVSYQPVLELLWALPCLPLWRYI